MYVKCKFTWISNVTWLSQFYSFYATGLYFCAATPQSIDNQVKLFRNFRQLPYLKTDLLKECRLSDEKQVHEKGSLQNVNNYLSLNYSAMMNSQGSTVSSRTLEGFVEQQYYQWNHEPTIKKDYRHLTLSKKIIQWNWRVGKPSCFFAVIIRFLLQVMWTTWHRCCSQSFTTINHIQVRVTVLSLSNLSDFSTNKSFWVARVLFFTIIVLSRFWRLGTGDSVVPRYPRLHC